MSVFHFILFFLLLRRLLFISCHLYGIPTKNIMMFISGILWRQGQNRHKYLQLCQATNIGRVMTEDALQGSADCPSSHVCHRVAGSSMILELELEVQSFII